MSTKKVNGEKVKRFEGIWISPDAVQIPPEGHTLFDREGSALPVKEELVCSLMAIGNKIPIIIRREGEALWVVAGRQRVKAALEANKRLRKAGKEPIALKAMMEPGDESAALGVCIVENSIRRVQSMTSQAELCRNYLATGKTEQDAALAFGVTVQSIKNWKKFDTLSAKVKKAVDAGQIHASAAAELADLSTAEQAEKLDVLLAEKPEGKKVSVKKAKAAAGKKSKAVFQLLASVEDHLAECKANTAADSDLVLQGYIQALEWYLGDESKKIELKD